MSLDCVVSFRSSLHPDQIDALLSTIVDGHVMWRTVEQFENNLNIDRLLVVSERDTLLSFLAYD